MYRENTIQTAIFQQISDMNCLLSDAPSQSYNYYTKSLEVLRTKTLEFVAGQQYNTI